MRRYSIFYISFIICILLLNGQIFSANKYVILVDVSGSLPHHDPHDYRKEALKLLIDQLEPESEIMFITFGTGAFVHRNQNNEVFFRLGDNYSWLKDTINALPRNHLFTDLKHGLEKTLIHVRNISSDKPVIALIFTDGQLIKGDIPEKYTVQEYINHIYDLSVELRNLNVVIYGLAFTRIADLEYLENLASITGGKAVKAEFAIQAGEAIIKLLHEIIYGPVELDTETTRQITIDSSVKAFSIHVFNKSRQATRPQVRLYNPNNIEETNYDKREYQDMLTITKDNPDIGQWQVKLSGGVRPDDIQARLFTTKKADFEVIFHSPRARDLILTRGSRLNIDIELDKVQRDILEQISSDAIITDRSGKEIKKSALTRTENRLYGSMETIGLSPGAYYLNCNIKTNAVEMHRTFILNIMEIEADIITDIKINEDLIIGNPHTINVKKDTDIEGSLKGILIQPDRKTSEFDLYDDGLEKHGDSIAGDGIYSRIIDQFKEAGQYNIDVIYEYIDSNIPITSKKSVQVLKMLESSPMHLKMEYPITSTWEIKGSVMLSNKTDYSILIEDIMLEANDLKLKFPHRTIEIKGRSTNKVDLIFEGNENFDENTCPLTITFSFYIPDLQQRVPGTIHLTLKAEPTPAAKAFRYGIILGAGLIIFFILGPTVIAPNRFKNKRYHYLQPSNESTIPYNYYIQRKGFMPKVKILNRFILGITIFGYGQWYIIDTEQKIQNGKKKEKPVIIKGFKNINDPKNNVGRLSKG